MPPLDCYCPRCGAACLPSKQLCPSCGSSLKATIPFASTSPLRTFTNHLAPNQIFKERYLILSQVGLGGFGAVYKAQDKMHNDRLVAIKEIGLRGLSSQQVIEATGSFNREVLLLSDLKHPGIPRIYTQLTDSEHWYLVMEFIEGETLEAYLAKSPDGCLPLNEVLKIGIRLCTLLEYLHNHQPPIIFRDLKPANIMLTPKYEFYLIDFGVARQFQPGKTKDTIAFGSPGYAAPEQYGRAQTTSRADIYSLGATLHQLLTGLDPSLSPFRFVPLRTHNPAFPFELEKLLAQMLELAVDQRPASAAVVKQELSRIAALPLSQKARAGHGGHSRRRRAAKGSSAARSAPQSFPTFSTLGVTVYIYSEHRAPILSVAWSLDGQRIASVSEDHTVRVWDAFSGRQRLLYLDRASVFADLAWSPDGQRLALASEDHTVHLMEVGSKPSPLRALALALGYKSTQYNRHASIVNAVCWSPNGQYIASAEDDCALHVWDVRTRETLLIYRGHTDVVNAVAWSPDGQCIASSSIDHSMHAWHAFTKKHILTYRKRGMIVNAVCWSPDGRYIAFAASNHTVQIWDVTTERRIYTYTSHSGSVLAVAWSPDGQRIASAGSDSTVQVWDPLNPDVAFIYERHEDKVFTVVWSPDGLHLASAGEDQSVHIWKAT